MKGDSGLDGPRAELVERVAELDEPGTELDEPGAELHGPGTELDEPGAELDEPGAELDELGTGSGATAVRLPPAAKRLARLDGVLGGGTGIGDYFTRCRADWPLNSTIIIH